jgi:hypothetical protein
MSTDITKIAGTEIQYLPTEVKRERKAVVVDRELERIYSQHQRITVDDVLADALNDESPLHSYFEWDDAAAGEKYRRVQAYSLIMSSKFIVQLVQDGKVEPRTISQSGQVRKLVSAFRGEGFRMRNEALADGEMRQAIIEGKKSVLRSWCESTIDIQELQPLRESILAKL